MNEPIFKFIINYIRYFNTQIIMVLLENESTLINNSTNEVDSFIKVLYNEENNEEEEKKEEGEKED